MKGKREEGSGKEGRKEGVETKREVVDQDRRTL